MIFNILITIFQCNTIFRNLLEFLLCTEKLSSERQIHRLYQTAEAIHGMENGENSDVNRKQGASVARAKSRLSSGTDRVDEDQVMRAAQATVES